MRPLLIIMTLLFVSYADGSLYISFDDIDTTNLNPKPENMDHLKILPPAQQASMVATPKPKVAHSNRSSSKGEQNVSLKGQRRTDNSASAFSKTKTERDNGIKDF